MNEIQLFNYEAQQVRTIVKNGEPWFVAADVCGILDIQNSTDAVNRLDADEKSTLDSIEGGPARHIINESGLYSLILGSRKPEAKSFKKWITSEVLPSIRKTGSYAAEPIKLPTYPEALRELAASLEQNALLVGQVSEMKPVVELHNAISASPDLYKVDEVGKILSDKFPKMGPRKIFEWMRDRKIIKSDKSRKNQAYQEHIDAGRFDVRRSHYMIGETYVPHVQTFVTQKGLNWLTDQLLKEKAKGGLFDAKQLKAMTVEG